MILLALRKYVVVSRIGIVTFSSARRRRVSWTCFAVIVVNFASRFVGFDFLELAENPDWSSAVKFGTLTLILFGIPAFFLEFRRLYVYGILAAGSPLLSELLYQQRGTVTRSCSA